MQKKFGDQCWMTDNLRFSRSKTGRMLNNVFVNSPYGEGEYYRTATVQWANNQVNYYPSADASITYGAKNPGASDMVPYDLDFNDLPNGFIQADDNLPVEDEYDEPRSRELANW